MSSAHEDCTTYSIVLQPNIAMQLLISVTRQDEVQAALDGGADIVDVKNPAEGALGTAPVQTLRHLVGVVPSERRTSAALGESDAPASLLGLAAYGAASLGVHYIKVGLRMNNLDEAVAVLRTIQVAAHSVNPKAHLIAVGYADAHRIGALSPEQLPSLAQDTHISGCMIDTAIKDGRGLFDYCDLPMLQRWLDTCRDASLLAALAGTLRIADLPALRELRPDIVGFRSAACRGDRVHGEVDAKLVAALRARLDD
jgi:uncharacterized protein (UPF0264 family)